MSTLASRTEWVPGEFTITPAAEKRYSDDQPRDENGRFEGGDAGKPNELTAEVIAKTSFDPTHFELHAQPQWVPTDQVQPLREYAPDQLRDPDKVPALAADIKENGFKDPIHLVYSKENQGTYIGEGNHRLAAAESLGLSHVPVVADRVSFAVDKGDKVPGYSKEGHVPGSLSASDIGLPVLKGSDGKAVRYSEDQPRDEHGRFGSGGDSSTLTKVVEPITASEVAGYPSREVSHEEFQKAAADGASALAAIQADKRPDAGPVTIDTDAAYKAVQDSWGGATIDPVTGEAKDFDHGFAVAIAGLDSTVELPETATKEEFDKAVDGAKDKFADQLQGRDTYFGVFHDDNKHTIDIDPVVYVTSQKDAENIAAYTHSVGGAYDFSTGDGVFPPHVAEQ